MTQAMEQPAPQKPSYTFRGEGTGLYQRLAWNAGRLVSRILSVLLFRFHALGQARIPRTGGVLMVTNHQSFLDPWLIGIAPARQIHSMARDTLYKGGFLHYLMELWNAFPVKRGHADLAAIRTAVDRLDKGFIVNIFPEGTRSEDGSIGPISPGLTLILHRTKTDVHIVPVLIDGAFAAWPRGSRFPRIFTQTPIRIIYGRPIPSSQWRPLSPDALALQIRAQLVALQSDIASPNAAISQRRLELDRAQVTENRTARRRK
jgi:1-acyl-sn-glycerol-3-phosphate acyltransferase